VAGDDHPASAPYIAKVFDDALRSNDAATRAKRAFLSAYNRLRASRGRSAVGDDF
jgi:hypothetical protein